MHPWHDVDLGKEFPDLFPAIVEIPKNSKSKFAMDPVTGLLRLKETLLTASRYPVNYGFVPRTYSVDDGPLDVLILDQEPIPPMTIVEVRPIGGFILLSPRKEPEPKIIAVHAHDPENGEFDRIDDLPHRLMTEIRQFFETYRQEQGEEKQVKDFFTPGKAREILRRSRECYEHREIAAA